MPDTLTLAHSRDSDDLVMWWPLVGRIRSMQRPAKHYCTACFSGDYRLDIDHPVTTEVVSSGQGRMFE